MNWKQVNFLGMGLTAGATCAIVMVLAGNGSGGLHEFRMINTLLLVAFSFVALAGVFSALGTAFCGFGVRRIGMLSVILAWLLSVPLAAWINMGGITAEDFNVAPGDWAWALLPALLYLASICMLHLAERRRPRDPAAS